MNRLGILCCLCLLAACEQSKLNQETSSPQMTDQAKAELTNPLTSEGASSLSLATIAIHSGDTVHNISAEVAVTDEERAKGLQNRKGIPANYGMWFVFPGEVQDRFWMKDTLISLDLIFVGADFKVVHIAANAVPGSEDLIGSDVPYQYVLEVNAGKAQELGIKVGDVTEYRVGPAE